MVWIAVEAVAAAEIKTIPIDFGWLGLPILDCFPGDRAAETESLAGPMPDSPGARLARHIRIDGVEHEFGLLDIKGLLEPYRIDHNQPERPSGLLQGDGVEASRLETRCGHAALAQRAGQRPGSMAHAANEKPDSAECQDTSHSGS